MSFENSCAPLLTCITFLHAFNASAIPHAQKCLWAISGQATGHEDERKERSVIWCLFPNRSRAYVNTHRPAQTSHKYRLVPVWGGGSSDIGFSQCARTMRVTATRTMNVMVSSVSFHMFQRSPCMVWFNKLKHITTVLVDACFIHLVILSDSYFAFTYRILFKGFVHMRAQGSFFYICLHREIQWQKHLFGPEFILQLDAHSQSQRYLQRWEEQGIV